MDDVENRVRALDNFVLEDEQPIIEGVTIAVNVDQSYSPNFFDVNAFETKWTERAQWKKKLIEEVPFIQKVDEIIAQGTQFVNMIYTYRSCSKALPQLQDSDDPRKHSLYEKTFEVLEPEIEKLKQLMSFQAQSITFLCEQVETLALQGKRDAPSEKLIEQLVRLLDMFALLDAVKSMKACLNNDFSFFKRTFAYLKKNLASDEQNNENHQMYLFLANNNSITNNLKDALHKINGFDDVLAMLADQCARHVEKNLVITPPEEHSLLRVMSYTLFLMDGPGEKNIFRSKKIKVQRFSALFKKTPVVPLFGDMQFTLEAMIRSSPNFDDRSWATPVDEARLAMDYSLGASLGTIRQNHDTFAATYSLMLHEIMLQHAGDITAVPYEVCKRVSDTVLRGLRLLSEWSGLVLRQSAWKYAHPTGVQTDAAEYERAVRYNYNTEERVVLVEVLAMIKGLSLLMTRQSGVLDSLLRRCIHDEVQEFVQITLREFIRAASKKTRAVRLDLLDLRQLASDWDGGIEPADPAIYGQKADKRQKPPVVPPRAVPPSPTQLSLVRSLVYGFIGHKYLGKRGMYADKDFGGSVKVLEEFYHRSAVYRYLLEPLRYVQEMSDMADLWYREFYLELSKRLQFPIEMSLPWILTDDIIETNNVCMTEFVFYPLDIYNDAANRALFDLNQSFLYEEIEAEVNLCFDQLVYKLADKTFNHYKRLASAALLDAPFKKLYEQYAAHMNRLEKSSKYESLQVAPARWLAILEQRHFSLLGRSIDLNALLAERLNKNLRRNIDYAISRFEGNALPFVKELEHHLTSVRLTRDLLTEHFELDPYEHAFHEANESISLVSFHGRIVLHVIFELAYDFLPNFNFNSCTDRWVRTELSFAEEVERSNEPRANPNFLYGSRALTLATAEALSLFSHFFGAEHVRSLVRLVGQPQLPLIVDEVVNNMQLKLHNVIMPYATELMKAMPPSSKLPMFDYGTTGGYGYFQLKLNDLIQYNELRTEVFQYMKEWGNSLAFMKTLEEHAKVTACFQYNAVAPFLGHVPGHRPVDGDASDSPLMKAVRALRATLTDAGCLVPSVVPTLEDSVQRACRLYTPGAHNYSLFKFAMQRVSQVVENAFSTWENSAPVNGVLAIDHTTEFYRLWSTMQFVSCINDGTNPFSSLSLFGHGLYWGGSSIVFLLGQRQRFEVLDFCYHVERMEQAAIKPVTSDGSKENENLIKFLAGVRAVRDLNNNIFMTLEMFSPRPSAPLFLLHPPETENLSDMKVIHLASTQPMAASPVPSPAASSSSSSTARAQAPPATASPRVPPPAVPPPAPTQAPPPPPPARDETPPPPPREPDAPPPPPPTRDDMPPPPPPSRDDMPPPPPPSRDDEPPPPPPSRDDMPPPPPPSRDDMPPPPPPSRDDMPPPPPPPR